MRTYVLLAALLICFADTVLQAQRLRDTVDLKYLPHDEALARYNEWFSRLSKTTGTKVRRNAVMSGNKITTIIYDYGSISNPSAPLGLDLVWNGLGYGYEFGPLVGASIVDATGTRIQSVVDGFISGADGDYQPGTDNKWGWLPTPGNVDSTQNQLAIFSDRNNLVNGKPKSWPETWFNGALNRYVWPSFLGDDATTPDEEAYWVMDDETDRRYAYYPFPGDSSRRGLGLQVKCRAFQFNNPLAEDIIFLVYEVSNVSPKRLDTVFFAMFWDPHVGGRANFSDDNGDFISPFNSSFPLDARNMLYAYDEDGVGDGGNRTGYFGFKFLESPSNPTNGEDDDGDGIADESGFNEAGIFLTTPDAGPTGYLQGVSNETEYTSNYGAPHPRWQGDEDGDWDLTRDDVGADGISGTGDAGEGDGKPTLGEPNFGFKDVAESDQIGLTSFNAVLFGGNNRPKNDPLMWQLISTHNQRPEDPAPVIEQKSDNVFIYGSGPFPLEAGETQRFSIALLLGDDLNDLVLNAVTAQQILRADYRFAQPPDKPTLTAVAGDKKVTLYWDTRSEGSVDALSGKKDFEGYKLYRSEDYTFSDVFTVTDASGNSFLGAPLTDNRGRKAQWDLVNEWKGLHPIEYTWRGAKYNLGDNTGLVHSFVDSGGLVNGRTYYYALVAYDHGDTGQVSVPPTETQHIIKRDPVTNRFTFDINTLQITPGSPASDIRSARLDPATSNGNRALADTGNGGTGEVIVEILNDAAVRDGLTYRAEFHRDSIGSWYDVRSFADSVEDFVARDTNAVSLITKQIVPASVVVRDLTTGLSVPSGNYILDPEKGVIKGSAVGSLVSGRAYRLTCNVYTVRGSRNVNGEDGNPVFDGMRVYAYEDDVALDENGSRWVTRLNNNFVVRVDTSDAGIAAPYPADFEVRFLSTMDTAGNFTPVDTSYDALVTRRVRTPFRIWNRTENAYVQFFVVEPFATRNQIWQPGELIRLYKPGTNPALNNTTYLISFDKPTGIPYEPPDAGDMFLISSRKPYLEGDAFSFATIAASVDQSQARSALANVYAVPNPFVMFSGGEVPDPRPGEPSERKLFFRNLPQTCTIRIYTVTGELVQTIEKNDRSSSTSWNLLSFEGQSVSYGIYIFHVDAPGVGTHVGRFAVIK